MSPTSMKRRLPQPSYSPPVTFVNHEVSGSFISVRRNNWNNLSGERFIWLTALRERSHCRLALWLAVGLLEKHTTGELATEAAHLMGFRKREERVCSGCTSNESKLQTVLAALKKMLSSENDAWTQEHEVAFKIWTITNTKILINRHIQVYYYEAETCLRILKT